MICLSGVPAAPLRVRRPPARWRSRNLRICGTETVPFRGEIPGRFPDDAGRLSDPFFLPERPSPEQVSLYESNHCLVVPDSNSCPLRSTLFVERTGLLDERSSLFIQGSSLLPEGSGLFLHRTTLFLERPNLLVQESTLFVGDSICSFADSTCSAAEQSCSRLVQHCSFKNTICTPREQPGSPTEQRDSKRFSDGRRGNSALPAIILFFSPKRVTFGTMTG